MTKSCFYMSGKDAIGDHENGPSLDILLGIANRLEEVLFTNLIKETVHRVHVIDSCETALKAVEKHCFSLIMLSNDMPGITTLTTIEELRKGPAAKTPTILILSNDDKVQIENGFLAGMNTWLSHPLKHSKLNSILNYYSFKTFAKAKH